MATGGSAKSIEVTATSEKRKHAPPASGNDARPSNTVIPIRPLKPRPVLLVVFAVIFAAWVGFLVTLYFKTVKPRHAPTHVTEAAPTASSITPPSAQPLG